MSSQIDQEQAALGFTGLGLNSTLLAAINKLGYEAPTPIQNAAIPLLLQGKDVLGKAATGTGKTAAFALPMLNKLERGQGKGSLPRALVLVPTRELANQVSEALLSFGQSSGIRVLPVYGGQAFIQQVKELRRGIDVVVATPGRALDHIRQKTLDLSKVEYLVLDEADEMLDMGFVEDIEALLDLTPDSRQTALFSATIPQRIHAIAAKHLKDPARVSIAKETTTKGGAPSIDQSFYVVPRAHKIPALLRLLSVEENKSAIIFCRTRMVVDELAMALNAKGHRVEPLHGGMSQVQRDRVMTKLRSSAAEIVVATDVAARGLDIEGLTHVINFDVPPSPETYVHRIGRVGRAGRAGFALTLAEPKERYLLKRIEATVRQKVPVRQLPSTADLTARAFKKLEDSLKQAAAGDLDPYADIVASLSNEFDLATVALAAIKLLAQPEEQRLAALGEIKIPHFAEPAFGDTRSGASRGPAPRERRQGSKPTDSRPMTLLQLKLGHQEGVRPQDLVGAITGEAGIRGREIGAIRIEDTSCTVEVTAELAQQVVAALRGTFIKGHKVEVRHHAAPSEARRMNQRR